MKIALIVNPYSGGRQVDAALPAVEAGLRRRRIAYTLYRTRSAAEAVDIVCRLERGSCDALVSMGGDGTNYQVLNGLLKADEDRRLPPLGIIPAGRGNSFARDLGLHSLIDGLDALALGRTQAVDLCRFTQPGGTYYFVNLMGLGFVTDVALTAARLPWLGDASYVLGVLYRVLGLTFHHLDLEIDGRRLAARNCFVEICNSRYTGGAMCMAPQARIDDGRFDVVLLAPLRRAKLVASFPRIFRGTHGLLQEVDFIQGRTAKIVTAPPKALLPDGEIFGTTPTRVDILARRLHYFALPARCDAES
jgi:diacylglycerol kinase (ATP)